MLSPNCRRTVIVLIFSIFLCLIGPAPLPAQTRQLNVLHAFTPVTVDTLEVMGPLVQAADGNFYGVSYNAIVRITPAGVMSPLYVFPDNSFPTAPLVAAPDGNLYGTTSKGGANGAGTVFKLTLSGMLTTLHTFPAAYPSSDGLNPYGGLILASDGNFYGATLYGGVYGAGTIFKITPQGSLTTLYSFNVDSDGQEGSLTSLIQGSDGNFYGTTGGGGPNGMGTVFKMTPDGTLTTLHTFNGSDGSSPEGLVEGSDGNYYGATDRGGPNDNGTIFQITPNGVFTSLYTFAGAYGAGPNGLTSGSDGNFYGTTRGGGPNGTGTVFKITPQGALTSLYSFSATNGTQGTNADGANPNANLALGSDGSFYGTTYAGGTYGVGTVFKITPQGVLTVLTSIPAGTNADGSIPNGLIPGADGNLYGTAQQGGVNGAGTVFRMTPTGTLTTLYAFSLPSAAGTNADGANPMAGLIQGTNGNFYGTTFAGGANGVGTVFQITPAGAFTTLASFGGVYGAHPRAALLLAADGNFYGTTSQGGANGNGTVFKITPAGALSLLYTFSATSGTPPVNSDGAQPWASLAQGSDGNFYGTTTLGGAGGTGTVFQITPAGAFTTLHAFSPLTGSSGVNAEGANPQAALVQGPDGSFYGTAYNGGDPGSGTVYKITPGGVLTVLHTFSAYSTNGTDPDGAHPVAPLLLSKGGLFYGSTTQGGVSSGGATGFGTLFRLSPSGTLTTIFTFTGDSYYGYNPIAGMAQLGDGLIFGVTGKPDFQTDSSEGIGIVFRLNNGKANSDLNRDGLPDLLFQNPGTGQLAAWFMNASTALAGAFLYPPQQPGWLCVGTRGIYPSEPPLLVFQNTATGEMADWTMQGNYAQSGEYLYPNPGPGWACVSVEDFNGDNVSDLVLQNTKTGKMAVWYMNPFYPFNYAVNGAYISPNPAPGWKCVGTGDFNGDGKPNLVFQNASTGQLAVWYMNGVYATGGAYITPTPLPGWQCVSVNDYNGDDHPDLVLRNAATGQMAIWYLNGVTAVNGAYITPSQTPDWLCVGIH
ncbi:MAG TPA: choice-of-anchor tandem repeat GloVer-containing protein [Chthonomonadaceae bacterium]|nr:choice-of-anchor tandem repeat GloVer-containing protein [Chthonomonadaceae bacterium]